MSQTKYKQHTKHKKQRPRWPVLLLVGGGLLLVFSAFLMLNRPSQPKAPIEVGGAPSLKVDQAYIDLGDIKLGKWVEVSFQLTNVGDKALRFAKSPYVEVKEGC